MFKNIKLKKYSIYIKLLLIFIIVFLFTQLLSFIPKIQRINKEISIFCYVIYLTYLVLYLIKNIKKISFLYRLVRNIVLSIYSLAVILLLLLIAWYDYCFFPNDQEYLDNVVQQLEYKGNKSEIIDIDLIKNIKKLKITNRITSEDIKLLKSNKLKEKNIVITENPYVKNSNNNNLKYATGKTFFYTYQKNSLVLKSDSIVNLKLNRTKYEKRYLDISTCWPSINNNETNDGKLKVVFKSSNKTKQILFEKKLLREVKPVYKPFKFSNVFKSIWFFLKNPSPGIIPENYGWNDYKINIPEEPGVLEIKFEVPKAKKSEYLFLGNPRIFGVNPKNNNKNYNVVFLLFDTLARYHLDIYEYYNAFKKNGVDNTIKKLGARKIVTPDIDKYFNESIIFEKLYTAGQVTRPSITSLWTSRHFNECRLPVFRNIVTDDNQKEFYNKKFETLGNILSENGYITSQICCNAEGHNVSGVGVDLGFDENHDYTMESSEYTANFKNVLKFLEKNQNRKFFLYAHLNVPHPKRWIPAKYFIKAYWDADFNMSTGIMLGNIRYLNDRVKQIIDGINKLKLRKNTMIVITADHGSGVRSKFRGYNPEYKKKMWQRESQRVATFHPAQIYGKGGSQSLYDDYMRLPFVIIPPINSKMKPGLVNSQVSAIDIAPTFIDLLLAKKVDSFQGKSFKNILYNKNNRNIDFTPDLQFTGRFQRGFILEGRYKYWLNILGMYKYRKAGNKGKFIQQQEYLFDLKKDPEERYNLSKNKNYTELLSKMRKYYHNKYIEFPDKNFIQISPGNKKKYNIKVKVNNGKIIYAKKYGKNIELKVISDKIIEYSGIVEHKPAFVSFETKPNNSNFEITILRDGKLLNKKNIYSSNEVINLIGNPFVVNNKTDLYLLRNYGKTGLEVQNIPDGSLYISRIPLNYWLEMSQSEKDIMLSPGIKEVLRGWGYIQ